MRNNKFFKYKISPSKTGGETLISITYDPVLRTQEGRCLFQVYLL